MICGVDVDIGKCCIVGDGDHRERHVRSHPFPARRAADLRSRRTQPARWSDATENHRLLSASSSARFLLQPNGKRMMLTKRSEEHKSELQSLMRTSYAVFCL